MDSRGFNLFTALVSFLLITLTVLLMQGMIQSERNASETLGAIEARREIGAIADNLITDAIQTFNYDLRLKIADFAYKPVGNTDSTFYLQPEAKKSDEIIKDFVTTKFGGNQNNQAFAASVTSELYSYFWGKPRIYKNYSIQVELAENQLIDPVQKVIADRVQNAIDNDKFFTVVGCEGLSPGNCQLGTFYVSLLFTEIPAEEYEKLPRISITSHATSDQIKKIIIPNENFRIYVPLRLFKAIAEARGLSHFSENSFQGVDAVIDDPVKDIGLMSNNTREEIKKLLLGMCDASNCSPRTNPCKPPTQTTWQTGCPGDTGFNPPVSVPLNTANCELPANQPTSYDAYFSPNQGSTYSGPKVLEKIVESKICDLAQKAHANGYFANNPLGGGAIDPNFKPIGTGCTGFLEGFLESANADASMDNATKKLIDEKGAVLAGKSYCTKTEHVSAKIAFEEKNPDYLIQQGQPIIYRIEIYDNWYSTQDPIGGTAGGPGWTCVSRRSPPINLREIPRPIRCELR